jgi:hypothetical protein
MRESTREGRTKMSEKKLVKRIKELRKAGVSFRNIEKRFPSALGAGGNGTKAYRLLARAA